MKLSIASLYVIVGVLVFAAQPVIAADQSARTQEDCKKHYDACYAACRNKYPEQNLSGDVARTTCGTTCAAQSTACQAAIEYEKKARPALEQMIDQLKGYLDDLLKTMPGGQPQNTPTEKSPKNESDQGPVKI